MPGYLYECSKCGQTVNVFRSITEPENVPACIKCADPMTRVYGLNAIAFKGSGFYSTDKR